MARTRLSSKYHVVIPREIREGLSLRPSQDLQIIRKGNIIMLVPDRPISAFRGILKGVSTTGVREKKDRL
jgi:AbrB family looped-hinge helix DNA binding protein